MLLPPRMEWYCKRFGELTTRELYSIVALRERVFVVEQRCAYLDADGLDLAARHLWGERGGQVLAYLRILDPGARYREASIGRVVVAPEARADGLGRELMQRGLRAMTSGAPIRISAQAYLERFYRELGFERASDDYDEDGIRHLEMLLHTESHE